MNSGVLAAAFLCGVMLAGCGGDSSSGSLSPQWAPVDAKGGAGSTNHGAGGAAGSTGASGTLGLGGYGSDAGYLGVGGLLCSGGSPSVAGSQSSAGAPSVGGSQSSGGSVSNAGGGLGSGLGSGGSSGAQLGSPGPTLADAGCAPLTGSPPTWSSIWSRYGFSSSCRGCHKQASGAASAYTWLQQLGQINGTKSPIATAYDPLVVQNTSVLTLFGGNMPQQGAAINPAAKCALVAWVVAGAKNN